MKIEVFRLLPVDGAWELDLDEKVGEVVVADGQVSIHCQNPHFENALTRIFGTNLSRFTGEGGQDVVEGLETGSQQWLDHILKDELYASSLGGRVVA